MPPKNIKYIGTTGHLRLLMPSSPPKGNPHLTRPLEILRSVKPYLDQQTQTKSLLRKESCEIVHAFQYPTHLIRQQAAFTYDHVFWNEMIPADRAHRHLDSPSTHAMEDTRYLHAPNLLP